MSPKRRQLHPEQLGERIKQLRRFKGLKIVDVAKMTGLTSSTISQVERSKMTPSIVTLKKIPLALEQPLGNFFTDEPDPASVPPPPRKSPVVHLHERKELSPRKGVTYHLLNPDMSGPIEMIYNIYEPGAGTGAEPYSHPGHECGLVLEGELRIAIDDQEYLLKQGDSITFKSSEPHSLMNVGKTRCVCVWATTPPWF